MKFSIQNNHEGIYIGFNELGSYLYNKGCLSSTWYCCYGTLAKFLCTSDSKKNSIESIEEIQSNLYNNYENNLGELKTVLSPIVNILRSGSYQLGFISGNNIKSTQLTAKWDIYIQSDVSDKSSTTNIAYNYYDNFSYRFIGTEAMISIDRQTVEKYEAEIKQGKRPFAIVLSSYYQPESDKNYPYKSKGGYEADWDSENFVLDGHHKLLAYKNLGVSPSYAIIHQRFTSIKETRFNYNEFSSILNESQKGHFLKNWESSNKYLDGKRNEY